MDISILIMAKKAKKLERGHPARIHAASNVKADMPAIMKADFDYFMTKPRNKGKDAIDFYFIKKAEMNKVLKGGKEHKQGKSFNKVFWMWTSLMLITGIGAFLGNIFFIKAPVYIFTIAEGIAAGAMLTMIAETMLPEAYYKVGAITVLSTLFGFLIAIFFKMLE